MPDHKVGTLRLRSVQFKDGGGYIRVLPSETREDDIRYAKKRVDKLLGVHRGRVAGFAMVVWGPDCSSACVMTVNKMSSIPSILAPDFVRNRLLAEQIEQWTIDDINNSGE